jgi:hypothetical protein
MILTPLLGMGLVTAVALGPALDPDPSTLSSGQKSAAIQPLVRRATECVVQTVAADPRYRKAKNLGDLVIDALTPCTISVRAMVQGYDHYFGSGSGEEFFIGPYLELLTKALNEQTQDLGPRSKAAPVRPQTR